MLKPFSLLLSTTLSPFFIVQTLHSAHFNDIIAPFRRPNPPLCPFQRHYRPFSSSKLSTLLPSTTLSPYFVVQTLHSAPFNDIITLFRRPNPPLCSFQRHYRPFSSSKPSTLLISTTLSPLFVVQTLHSAHFNDIIAPFRRPNSPLCSLQRHYRPISSSKPSTLLLSTTLSPFFVVQTLLSAHFDDIITPFVAQGCQQAFQRSTFHDFALV